MATTRYSTKELELGEKTDLGRVVSCKRETGDNLSYPNKAVLTRLNPTAKNYVVGKVFENPLSKNCGDAQNAYKFLSDEVVLYLVRFED